MSRCWLPILLMLPALLCGCGSTALFVQPSNLFGVPLEVNGTPVGNALLDTGGGFEVLLKKTSGLEVTGSTTVLAFGGFETVKITEGFLAKAGGVEAFVNSAIVGLSTCDCNGVGYPFLRKTNSNLVIRYPTLEAGLVRSIPPGALVIPFHPPPAYLSEFDTSFMQVTVSANGGTATVNALFDTGANITVIRRGILPPTAIKGLAFTATLNHPELGTVQHVIRDFTTPNLPDMIIGTDLMKKWADVWFFQFSPAGGGHFALFINDDDFLSIIEPDEMLVGDASE